MSEAERDIESIIDGKVIQPNRLANAAYKQKLVHYMMDHEEDMDQDTVQRMIQYISSLDQIIVSNTMRQAQDQARKEQEQMMAGQAGTARPAQLRQPGPSQPLQDVIQQNVR
jgi:dihydroorotase-like cyclic amidohydrolase